MRRGDGAPGLTVSLQVKQLPGSAGVGERLDLRSAAASARLGGGAVRLRAATTAAPASGGAEVAGIIENVPLVGGKENEVELTIGPARARRAFNLPGYGISGVSTGKRETDGGAGDWEKWKALLAPAAKPAHQPMLAAPPPTRPTLVKKVEFELLPLYATLEEGTLSPAEMDPPMVCELNDTVYGQAREKVKALYGTNKVFSIEWKFELRNASARPRRSRPGRGR